MHEHLKKQAREVFMAFEGGTLTHSWWKSGLAARRRKAAEKAVTDDSPPPDEETRQRRRENRMRTSLGFSGFLLSDPKPKYDFR